jgi:hypothetical protein
VTTPLEGERRWITIEALPSTERGGRAIPRIVARALGLPLADASALVQRVPCAIPKAMDASPGDALAAELSAAGARVVVAHRSAIGMPCAAHPRLDADTACSQCGAYVCAICVALAGEERCGGCAGKRRRSRAFFHARVGVLLLLLAGVLLYAWNDVTRRRERTDWRRTVVVGLVLVRLGDVDPRALDEMRARVPVLESRLAEERARYGGDGTPPFAFVLRGPVEVTEAPPALRSSGIGALAEHTYATWRWVSDVDARGGLDDRGLDARIYLVVRPGRAGTNTVEGGSQQGGRVGVVEVDLAEGMADFALFVAVHELMHTLGATDKYDERGHPLVPAGLAEPDLEPRYPQRYAEIMARHRATGPDTDAPPDGLGELLVGDATAREIGWTGD